MSLSCGTTPAQHQATGLQSRMPFEWNYNICKNYTVLICQVHYNGHVRREQAALKPTSISILFLISDQLPLLPEKHCHMDEQATTESINQRSLLCFVLQDGGLIKS